MISGNCRKDSDSSANRLTLTGNNMSENPPYRTDLINAAMGAQRLSNERLAKRAGVGAPSVSRIRNGYTSIGYMTLKKVVEALGLTMAEIFTPKENSD